MVLIGILGLLVGLVGAVRASGAAFRGGSIVGGIALVRTVYWVLPIFASVAA